MPRRSVAELEAEYDRLIAQCEAIAAVVFRDLPVPEGYTVSGAAAFIRKQAGLGAAHRSLPRLVAPRPKRETP